MVPDLPPTVQVGEAGLSGSLTIANANTGRQADDSNLVLVITLTPSCWSSAMSAECPSGSEDPGVVSIDSPATGRAGTACAGTVFTVSVSDAATEAATFDPPGEFITRGPASGALGDRQCVIDFTFSVTAAIGRRAGVGANWSPWAVQN